MAVTVNDKTIIFTAQSDRWDNPIVIKSISWTGVTTAGHLLEIAQSSVIGSNTKVLYRDVADAPNYVNKTLIELYYPFGVEITDLDSGEIQIYVK